MRRTSHSTCSFSQYVLSRQAGAQESVDMTVCGAHLLTGDSRHGQMRQVLQDGAAPGDQAAMPGCQRRRPVVLAILHLTESLL